MPPITAHHRAIWQAVDSTLQPDRSSASYNQFSTIKAAHDTKSTFRHAVSKTGGRSVGFQHPMTGKHSDGQELREELSLVEDDRPVALVTGSTSGIGEAIARRFVHEGYNVVLHSRSSENKGRSLAAELKSASYVQADLARESDRIRLIHEAVGLWGRLDVLVNNAGLSGVIPHTDLRAATSEIWHELYEVNMVAPFHLIAEAETALRNAAQHGRTACIVNISSHAGVRPKGASIPYAATKAALNQVTRLLALSLAPAIRVNAVAPGLVDTPLTADWTAAQELWRTRAPMRRPASPEDIAQAVMMLVQSDYLTGEILLSDGGLNLT